MSTWSATLAVLIGGIMEGSFALPMKFAKRWAWENIWLVYSVIGLAVIPWVFAYGAVPDLALVYRSTPSGTLSITALFGFCWGVANVLFGLAVPIIGMALSFAIVVGISAALGSLVPLILLNSSRLGQPSGSVVVLGVALTLVGVTILGIAGRGREKVMSRRQGEYLSRPISLGLLLCLLAGILAPMLNFSFAFGSQIVDQAIKRGATPEGAVNAIWAVALTGGLFSNGGYCVLRLVRNNTWSNFQLKGAGQNWIFGALMGLLWTGGLLLYGRGASALGDLGPAIGWPTFQATMILASSFLGAISGEWQGAEPRFVKLTCAALATLIAAIVVLSVGNRL